MLNPHEVLELCRNASGTNEKIDIIQSNISDSLKFVLENACSPYITFGVKQYEMSEPITHDDFDQNWEMLKRVLHHLQTRGITGDAAKKAIFEASKHLNKDQQNVMNCILQKDLRCGLAAKSVNKAIPGLIPEFNVQLANKDREKILYPCLVETKRNGKRVIAFVHIDTVDYFSRDGNSLFNLHIFDKELIDLAAGSPSVFDGEISGNTGDHTQDYKMAQSVPRKEDPNFDASHLRYTVWDMMPMGNWIKNKFPVPQKQRSAQLKGIFLEYWDNQEVAEPRVVYSKQKTIENETELLGYFDKVLEKGNEGLIVKNPNGLYEFKRSNAWIKMKCESDADLTIVDVVEGLKSWKGTLGSVVVDYNGNRVHCGLKGFTREEAAEMWNNRQELIGRTARIVYMNETPDSLYLPKFVELRDDK